ncbi:MAG: Uma2 family endonuclease [Pirellulales bacterium]
MASLHETPTFTPLSPAIYCDRPVHRLSVAEFERMIELGFLVDQRVELLEGVIVEMTPVGPEHCYTTSRLTRTLRALLETLGWHVEEQWPIGLPESRPQPDVVVIQGSLQEHARQIPTAAEVSIAIEVSDSTLPADRAHKARLYAAAGVEQYWIVNLVDRQIETFAEPAFDAHGGCEYRRRSIIIDQVEVILGGQRLGAVRVADILPTK